MGNADIPECDFWPKMDWKVQPNSLAIPQPDLTPDNALWGIMKGQVLQQQPRTVADLTAIIEHICAHIDADKPLLQKISDKIWR